MYICMRTHIYIYIYIYLYLFTHYAYIHIWVINLIFIFTTPAHRDMKNAYPEKHMRRIRISEFKNHSASELAYF